MPIDTKTKKYLVRLIQMGVGLTQLHKITGVPLPQIIALDRQLLNMKKIPTE